MASESEAFHPSSFRIRDAHIYKNYQTLERAYTSHSAYLNSTVSLTTAFHPSRSYKRIIENRLFTTFRLPSIFLLVAVTQLIFYDMCISPTYGYLRGKYCYFVNRKLYNMQMIAKIFSKYKSILIYFYFISFKIVKLFQSMFMAHVFPIACYYTIVIYIVSIFKKNLSGNRLGSA